MSSIKVGVIGAGRMGKIHIENITYKFPDVEIAAVVDKMEAGQEFARKLGVSSISCDEEIIFENPDIKAVVICSPTDTHADLIIRAAETGKSILCEKPLDLSLKRAKEVIEIVEKKGSPLMVAFNRRFDANFRKARHLVDMGEVGTPHLLKITSRDPGLPPYDYIKSSGGMFMDMTIHDIDMARFIMDAEIEEVFAMGAARVDPALASLGDIDTAILNLKFDNGAMGVIDNCREAKYGYDQRLEVFGSKGMTIVDNQLPDTHRLYNDVSVSQALPLHFFMERYSEAYYHEIHAFIDAIAENKSMPVTGQDALVSIAVALAAKASMERNAPVKVAEFL